MNHDLGKFPSEWQFKTVDEIKSNCKHAIAMGPFGSNIKTENYVSSGVPVIRGTNLNYYKYPDGMFVFVSEQKANELKASLCVPDDLIFTHRGTLGQVGLIPSNKYAKYLVSQSGMKLSVNKEVINPLFAFYFFKSELGQNQLLQYESQVGVPAISNPLTSLKKIILPIPPLAEQRAIASVLSNLDDKIDLLHRQNATLEAMAEALFKQWFVVERNEEWEERCLGDLVSITRGASPRPIIKFIDNGTVPWIKIADATSSTSFFINKTKEFIVDEGVKKSVEVFPGDLILSNSATCGQPFIVNLYGCIHDGWLLFRNFEKLPKYILFFLLRYISRELNQIADGSVQDNLNTELLKNFPVRLPDTKQLIQFNNIIQKYVQKIHSNQTQICTLEKLRDTLLPKLMSGEVRVSLD
ncbi:MAG: restriction endonuclease subunit S [Desulfovibrio sp.]|uniref:restriction endonuclease subunit S n=1 Tax=Desulfovibrio sp. TaxID=885 RepID=UPI001A7BD64C|nr:restriction endonuclease subunit S [Desulfovibrio sp.]MBD5416837.1 restriction endonuclease subunit S [Desulfovibrio sp.]